MSADGTVTAPDGSGRQVKVITAEDVVAYLKAHPNFFNDHADLAGELGLSPRVSGLRSPGMNNWNLRLGKNFRITERLNLGFRASSFNLLNHPNFGQPNGISFATTKGRSSATATWASCATS